MEHGKVKWFNATKGYGFIEQEKGGGDVFLHISTLERSGIKSEKLMEGQKVSYELSTNREGKTSAINLKLLDN